VTSNNADRLRKTSSAALASDPERCGKLVGCFDAQCCIRPRRGLRRTIGHFYHDVMLNEKPVDGAVADTRLRDLPTSWTVLHGKGSLANSSSPQLSRKRAVRADVLTRRDAIALVRPLGRRIAQWQLLVAQLSARAAWARRRGDDTKALEQQLEALEGSVCTELAAFSERLQGTSPELRNHGRVLDAVRAAGTVLTALRRAKAARGELHEAFRIARRLEQDGSDATDASRTR
jgi:hypothetical protein